MYTSGVIEIGFELNKTLASFKGNVGDFNLSLFDEACRKKDIVINLMNYSVNNESFFLTVGIDSAKVPSVQEIFQVSHQKTGGGSLELTSNMAVIYLFGIGVKECNTIARVIKVFADLLAGISLITLSESRMEILTPNINKINHIIMSLNSAFLNKNNEAVI